MKKIIVIVFILAVAQVFFIYGINAIGPTIKTAIDWMRVAGIKHAKHSKKVTEECRKDSQCFAFQENLSAATSACVKEIETLARYDMKWTDGLFESKLHRAVWIDEKRGIIAYAGNKAKFQNEYGAYAKVKYSCLFDAINETAYAVSIYAPVELANGKIIGEYSPEMQKYSIKLAAILFNELMGGIFTKNKSQDKSKQPVASWEQSRYDPKQPVDTWEQTQALAIKSGINRELKQKQANVQRFTDNSQEYIYFAAKQPPEPHESNPDSKLCYRFDNPSLDVQLAKLREKYGDKVHDAKIRINQDGGDVLELWREAENGERINYRYFTNPIACDLYQKDRGIELAGEKSILPRRIGNLIFYKK